jgi:subtilisin family serine protease
VQLLFTQYPHNSPPNTIGSSSARHFIWFSVGSSVRAAEAWNAGVTGAGVRVCVLDEGFDMSHLDLLPNINQVLSIDITVENLDGRPDYLLPYWGSHGSHVAGIIAAANSKFLRVQAIVAASARCSYITNNIWPVLLLPSL